ncbi:MAG: 4Fe-4S dicluster domain-containing protein [Phycisphaeraceae bacterium]|nr:4Fe-4S dicluster domain-containing protein [Phycisphaeraceae bacterium]
MSDEGPTSRRGFFRALTLAGLDRAEEAGERVGRLFKGDTATPPPRRWLRPPGARPESEFLTTCESCGECVQACPAQCIRLDAQRAGGGPYIIARESPCVVCDDLACMPACPTDALQLVDHVQQIDMGWAIVDHDRCLRTEPDGEDCRLCVEPCPEGEAAIGINPQGLVEVRDGCIGCGVCEHACPTEPASIVVEPHHAGPSPERP